MLIILSLFKEKIVISPMWTTCHSLVLVRPSLISSSASFNSSSSSSLFQKKFAKSLLRINSISFYTARFLKLSDFLVFFISLNLLSLINVNLWGFFPTSFGRDIFIYFPEMRLLPPAFLLLGPITAIISRAGVVQIGQPNWCIIAPTLSNSPTPNFYSASYSVSRWFYFVK